MENYLNQQLPLYAFPAFSQDATMNNLRTQLILVESEYKALAATSTRGQRLEGKAEELRTLRAQLVKQAGNLAEALRADFTIRSAQEQNLLADQRSGAKKLEELSQESTRLAQSFGDPTLMRKLAAEMRDAGIGPANMIVPVDLAYPPARPNRPKLVFYLLLGGALGGLAGLALAAINVLLDTSLKSVEQIETQLGLPCLAVLPRQSSRLRGSPREDLDRSPGLGFLQSHLLSPSRPKGACVVGFSPVSSSQRSSVLVADLALLLARSGKRTLVVDLQFQDPQIAKLLGVDVKAGIESWIQSDAPIGGCLGFATVPGLAVLSASRRNADLAARLSRRPLAAEWAALASEWDFVLIDAPCLLSDWSLNLSLPSGAPLILTADFHRTKTDMIRQACSHARGPRWEVEGVVLTNAPRRIAV
jgi:Mrp family chromosome partitioning ATPase